MVGASAMVIANNSRHMEPWAILLCLAVLILALLVWAVMYLWDNWLSHRLARRSRRR